MFGIKMTTIIKEKENRTREISEETDQYVRSGFKVKTSGPKPEQI